jgi:hypothetical protein
LLAEWLIEQQVEEAVMESTAQYWKPVGQALEQYWQPACQKREGAGRSGERCTWRKRCPIVGGEGARTISSTLNDW